MIVLLTKYLWVDQIKNNKIGGHEASLREVKGAQGVW